MIFNKFKLGEFVDTISDTTKINKNKVILINTSDVLEGIVTNHEYTDNNNLKGQFKKRFKRGDILYSEIRPANKRFAYIDFDSEDYIASTKLMVLRSKNNIDNRFLYNLLSSNEIINKLHEIAVSRSGTFPQITFTELSNLEVSIPDYKDQIKIGKFIDLINKKITLNTKINNNLHELISSMYDELVSNADWDEVELSQVASVSSGKRPTIKNETGEYPIIGANGIMAYTNEFNMNSDLIITGRVGTLGVVKRYYKPIWASDNTLIVNTKYLNYIESYLKTIDYNSLNRGSTQPLLTQGDLNKQTLLFSENEVLEFENKVTPIVNKIRFNEEQNEILIQLRDTLLPKLMNGDIDLDNVEI